MSVCNCVSSVDRRWLIIRLLIPCLETTQRASTGPPTEQTACMGNLLRVLYNRDNDSPSRLDIFVDFESKFNQPQMSKKRFTLKLNTLCNCKSR